MLPTSCAHGFPGVKLIASAACAKRGMAMAPAASVMASRLLEIKDFAFMFVFPIGKWWPQFRAQRAEPRIIPGLPQSWTACAVVHRGHRAGSRIDAAAVAARVRILVEVTLRRLLPAGADEVPVRVEQQRVGGLVVVVEA